MATLTWNESYGFTLANLDLSDLLDGVTYTRSPARLTIEYDYNGSFRDEFRGYGFSYDVNGIPISGVVTGYASYSHGRKVASIDGASISVTSLVSATSTFSISDDLRIFKSALGGNDKITGGIYNDKLEGFGGNDVLYGRQGADKLYGSSGADVFTFKSIKDSTVSSSGRDTIYDFSASQRDKIDLRSMDSNTKTAGNQAFSFIGKNAFHDKAGELRYEKSGSGCLVSGDVNGDGSADFSIYLRNLTNLSKSYFLL